jgi:hypothetical protein
MKRFRFDGVDLVENATGRWVRYEEVAELEAERDRLRAMLSWTAGALLDAGDLEGHEKVMAALEGK